MGSEGVTTGNNQHEKDAGFLERQVALQILLEYDRSRGYSNILIRKALDAHPELSTEQRSFIKRLTEGTIERRIWLDGIIRRSLRNPDARLRPAVRCILRLSVYEIYCMDSVTDYAAVNEAVKLLKAQGLTELTGFVNAVLRNICRHREEEGKPHQTVIRKGGTVIVTRGTQRPLSGVWSMPQEIVQLWTDDYGEDVARHLLESMQQIRPVCIRMDPRVSGPEQERILQAMKAQGVEVESGRWLPYAFCLRHTGKITDLPGFREGFWTVQDESSMMVCEAAGLRAMKGKGVVLDLCAAPGGKSLHAAGLLPEGKVWSFDLTRARTDRIRENAARMHLSNLTIEEHDAEEYNPSLENLADVVLCDLPCSGLGVMARKKDIRYGFSREKIRSLCALQRRILKNAVHYVKPGGVLLYSTCTIDLAENDQMAKFIEGLEGMKPDPLSPFLPEGLPGIRGNCLQLLPYVHDTDGFFLARFVRK